MRINDEPGPIGRMSRAKSLRHDHLVGLPDEQGETPMFLTSILAAEQHERQSVECAICTLKSLKGS